MLPPLPAAGGAAGVELALVDAGLAGVAEASAGEGGRGGVRRDGEAAAAAATEAVSGGSMEEAEVD